MSKGNILALDVGERRIGVAIASDVAKLASAFTTIDRNEISDVSAWINKTVDEQEIGVIVVGLPRGMQGQETEQTLKIRQFASRLENSLDIPVVLQDEAVTSAQAEDRLKMYGKPYSKGDIDAEAARIILEDYLSSLVGRTG